MVNDADFVIWQRYGVRAWPTLVLIDPQGYVVAATAGEGHGPTLDSLIGELIAEHRASGTLREGPGPILISDGAEATPLAFPGKLAVDSASGGLAIADSGHHRIVIADLDGSVQAVAGTGMLGAQDGPFAEASFRHPQGLAFHEGRLYVADTENHLIRRLEPATGGIETIAGTGRQAHGPIRTAEAGPLATDLNSPWDLVVLNGILYIAMAGSHQVWGLDLARGRLELVCGTGQEALKVLYPSLQRVETLFGTGRPGTAHGDRPQFFEPGGLAAAPGRLYIADTNNHRIRVADLSSQIVTVLPLRGV